jgi:hypothetical protein
MECGVWTIRMYLLKKRHETRDLRPICKFTLGIDYVNVWIDVSRHCLFSERGYYLQGINTQSHSLKNTPTCLKSVRILLNENSKCKWVALLLKTRSRNVPPMKNHHRLYRNRFDKVLVLIPTMTSSIDTSWDVESVGVPWHCSNICTTWTNNNKCWSDSFLPLLIRQKMFTWVLGDTG